MRFTLGFALALAACQSAPAPAQSQSLADARKGHVTVLTEKVRADDALPTPPKGVLDLVHYTSPAGSIAGYLTPLPTDGAKHPAIIWISGGDNMIGDFWSPRPRSNDQSARAFHEAGIVTFYPSMRGGNGNPGYREGMYGEVDDILAAADWLAKQPGVDPARIYLGGHSTGGTLALLIAEIDPRFRATFAFGPVASPETYGDAFPVPAAGDLETRLRAPGYWLDSIKSPVFVIEGEDNPGNIRSLDLMAGMTQNPNLHFNGVAGFNHFSVLAPVTELIAQRILADTGPKSNIAFSKQDFAGFKP